MGCARRSTGEGEGFGDRPQGQHREEGEGAQDQDHHGGNHGEQARVGGQGAGAGGYGLLAGEASRQQQQGDDRQVTAPQQADAGAEVPPHRAVRQTLTALPLLAAAEAYS